MRKKRNKRLNLWSDEGQEEMINKIINGKMDNIELVPLKRFNTKWASAASRHDYPIDVLTCGSHVVVTADIGNRVNIWSLDSHADMAAMNSATGLGLTGDLIKSIKLSNSNARNMINSATSTSIWSICIGSNDRYIF